MQILTWMQMFGLNILLVQFFSILIFSPSFQFMIIDMGQNVKKKIQKFSIQTQNLVVSYTVTYCELQPAQI